MKYSCVYSYVCTTLILYLSFNYVSCYANYMTNSVRARIFLNACIVFQYMYIFTVYVN